MYELQSVEPHEAGLNPVRLGDVTAFVERGWSAGYYLGASWLILRQGAVAAHGCVGLATEEPATPVTPATRFDLASLTKPVVTATCILALAERGEFHLEQEVARFLPERAARPLAGITLRHLLTHTSGLPAWRQYHSHGHDRERILHLVQTAERERPIGTGYVYSDLGFILLGTVAERVSGRPLDQLAAQLVLGPLGMGATSYLPAAATPGDLAATRCLDRGRVLLGEVHDGNCADMGGVAGHAGLFGTAGDLARYAAMLLAGGDWHGRRILGPLAVRQLAVNQLDPAVGGSSLGWFTPPNGMLPKGDFLPADSFGHTGFTGTSLVLCPSLDLAVVLLTNRVYYDRDAGEFLAFRRRFHNAVAAAVTDVLPRRHGDTGKTD